MTTRRKRIDDCENSLNCIFSFQSPFNRLEFAIKADNIAMSVFDITSNGRVITKQGVNLETQPYIEYNVSLIFLIVFKNNRKISF
jgi:hypothetical protein